MTDDKRYPPLPKHLHTAGYLAKSPPLYTAAQMKEFADATCALRATLPQKAAPSQDAADTVRLDWLIEQRAYVVSDPDSCQGYWLEWAYLDGSTWVQVDEHETPRAAIDAAKGPA